MPSAASFSTCCSSFCQSLTPHHMSHLSLCIPIIAEDSLTNCAFKFKFKAPFKGSQGFPRCCQKLAYVFSIYETYTADILENYIPSAKTYVSNCGEIRCPAFIFLRIEHIQYTVFSESIPLFLFWQYLSTIQSPGTVTHGPLSQLITS